MENNKQLKVIFTGDTAALSAAFAKVGAESSDMKGKLSGNLKQTQKDLDDTEQSAGRFGSTLGTLGSRIRFVAETLAVYGLGRSIVSFFSGAGQLEQTNMAFQSLIGNAQQANQVFSQLVQYANVTPFQSKDIVQAAQTLMGFGTAGQQTVDIIKQLGDVVSVGGGNMQQLALVTGQIFAQGKLRAQDMYQVINDGGAGLIKIMAQNVGGMQNLTAEFDKGGIPAKQYFDAVLQATSRGGFAFQGAQREADTFNGRLSTLKDSVTQFGEALIGVRIDPKLGLVVEPGGVFDRLKGAITGISTALAGLRPIVDTAIPAFLDKISKLASVVGDALGSSFSALWSTLTTKVMPALTNFWHNVIEPLLPVIGGALVAAIWGAINILNGLFQIITPVINFLANNTWVIYGLATAFTILKGAMLLDATFTALRAGFAVITGTTIPSVTTSILALRTLTMSSVVMGGVVTAGALADIALVMKAVDSVRGAINAMNAAKASAVNAASSAASRVSQDYALLLSSDPATRDRAQADLKKLQTRGYATGTNYAPGGMAIVGENGPELIQLPRGSQVKTAPETQKIMQGGSVSLTVNVGVVAGNNVQDLAATIYKELQRLSRANGFNGALPNIGVAPTG